MADYAIPVKNEAFTFFVALRKQSDTKLFQDNPTLAAGDVKVQTDDGTLANITTLPTGAASSKRVKVSLSAAEMNGDNVWIQFSDAAGAEWCDLTVCIQTAARGIDDLAYPATSGRSMAVAADGGVAPDWANIKSPTTTVKTATDVETKIGTPANLGGGATIAQNLSDIEAQTDDIGVAGAGLTDLGGMSTTRRTDTTR